MPDISINLNGDWNPNGIINAVTSAYASTSNTSVSDIKFFFNFDQGTAERSLDLDGNVSVVKTKEQQPMNEAVLDQAPPPGSAYRDAEGADSCGSCAHFKDGACQVWNASVDAGKTCNSYESHEVLEDDDHYALSEGTLGELYLAGSDANEDDGLIWKTVLRTGTWQYRPGPGQVPVKKPLKVVLSNPQDDEIALQDILDSFDGGAIEHVTIPLSHNDRVDENTGYVRKLRIIEEDGVHKLQAGHEFTDPTIREKVLNRSIANTSVGLLFDYLRKQDGKRFKVALQHVALTNRPWINGMEPFGSLAASEDTQKIVGLEFEAEDPTNEDETVVEETTELSEHSESDSVEQTAAPVLDLPATPQRVLRSAQRIRELRLSMQTTKEESMSDSLSMFEGLELSDEQREYFAQQQAELDRLRKRDREREVEAKVAEYGDMGLSEHPGLLKVIRDIMLADDGGAALTLSEEGNTQNLTATEIVKRMVDALPKSDDGKVNFGEQVSGLVVDEKPPVDASAEKPLDERASAAREFLGVE